MARPATPLAASKPGRPCNAAPAETASSEARAAQGPAPVARPVRWQPGLLLRRWLATVRWHPAGRTGAVLRLALPAVAEQLLNMTVGLVDTFLVGHLGASALSAVSISNQFVMLATVLFASVATGSTALIARSIGAEDLRTARRTLNQSMLMGALIGIASTVLGVLLARQAVRLMGATGETLPLAESYLRIVSCTFLLSTWLFIGNACLRGAGDTLTTMRVMMLVNVVNVVVASTLIYGPLGLPRLGVAGSALGAAAGRTTGGLVILALLWRGRPGLRLHWRAMRPDLALIRRILQIGIPTGVEQMLMRLGQSSYLRVVTTLGMTAVAAHAVALNAESLSYMPGFGFAIAATTLVGQGLGAGQPQRAEADGYLAYKLGAGVMSFMGLVFFFFAGRIVGFFTTDPQVIALGSGPLRLVAVAQPLLASSMIFSGGLRGAGDTRWPMAFTALGVWLVRVPLAILFVLVLRLGLMGAWYAMVIDLATRGVLAFLRFRAGDWKAARV